MPETMYTACTSSVRRIIIRLFQAPAFPGSMHFAVRIKIGCGLGRMKVCFLYCPNDNGVVEVKSLSGLHIHALYQSDSNCLYIGTEGNGLLVYRPEQSRLDTVKNSGVTNVYAVWEETRSG